MCDLSDGFVLCACDDGAPDWILSRLNSALPPTHIRGRWRQPTFDEDEQTRIRLILDGLNGGGCFDFAYEAREGDVFEATIRGKSLGFRFHTNQWHHDLLSPFAPWSSQLEQAHTGDLVLPPDVIPAEHLERNGRDPHQHQQVLQDWILSEGHPDLSGWLEARLRGEESPLGDKLGPKIRTRLEKVFPPSA